MEKTFKRLLSFAVALVMILGMIPVTQIEAKAETTNEVQMSYTSWSGNATTGYKLNPATKTIDISKINEPLSGTPDENGVIKAYCYVCKNGILV